MTIESLVARLRYAAGGDGIYIFCAVIRDFLRSLHEIFTKSGRDQAELISQVQKVLGSTAAHHLSRIIDFEGKPCSSGSSCEATSLFNKLDRLCRERGISLDKGKMLFSSFLRSLDEERLDGDGNSESTLFLTYMTVGDEAAFHLGGFFVGDAAGMVFTEMQYLDRRLKRFQTIIDLWEMELAWDQEDRA